MICFERLRTWQNLKNNSKFGLLEADVNPIAPAQFYFSDFRYESNGIFVIGWVFFLQTGFDFLTSHFWQNFLISFKKYCCLELKLENIFHLWLFFVKLWGFKHCHFGQFPGLTFINRKCLSYISPHRKCLSYNCLHQMYGKMLIILFSYNFF